MEESWRTTEEFLDLRNQPPNLRAKFKLAFTMGWQGGTNYHTGTKGVPHAPENQAPVPRPKP